MFRFLILMRRTAASKLRLYNLFSYVAAHVSLNHLLQFWILKRKEYFLFPLTFQYSLACATYESMKLCPSISFLAAFVVKSNSWMLIVKHSLSGNLAFWFSLDRTFCMIKIWLGWMFGSLSKTCSPLAVQPSCTLKWEAAASHTWKPPMCSSSVPVHVQLCPDLSSLCLAAA